jgi:hypothetical protein
VGPFRRKESQSFIPLNVPDMNDLILADLSDRERLAHLLELALAQPASHEEALRLASRMTERWYEDPRRAYSIPPITSAVRLGLGYAALEVSQLAPPPGMTSPWIMTSMAYAGSIIPESADFRPQFESDENVVLMRFPYSIRAGHYLGRNGPSAEAQIIDLCAYDGVDPG